ncbi:unnamed protein product, partial [Discosporangium mesarthrocarpum]
AAPAAATTPAVTGPGIRGGDKHAPQVGDVLTKKPQPRAGDHVKCLKEKAPPTTACQTGVAVVGKGRAGVFFTAAAPGESRKPTGAFSRPPAGTASGSGSVASKNDKIGRGLVPGMAALMGAGVRGITPAKTLVRSSTELPFVVPSPRPQEVYTEG